MSEAERNAVALRLAAELARANSEGEAAAAASRAAGLLIGADCVRVWMIDRNHGYRFAGHWPDTDAPPESPPADLPRVIAFGSPAASAADPPYRSRLTVPLLAGHRPLGAVELLERQRPAGPLEAADAESLRDLIKAADAALEGVRKSASAERGRLEAIMRLTRLFDLGRTIAGALEMEQLARVIVNRIVSAFDIENAYLWMPDESGETLSVNAAAGPVAETVLGWELAVGDGAAGTAAASGESMLFDDETAVPGIDERPDLEGGLEINTLIVVPIVDDDEQVLGVLEAVNRDDGEPLDESDLAVIREIAETAAIAIGNVRRFDAERRASDLTALLSTAQELGTHLDVQKVTFALVHQAASVLAYRRAAVGLVTGGDFRLVAVSGETFVDDKLPEMKALKDLLTWAAALDDGLYVVQEDDGSIDTDRPETREKFRAYFETTGSRSFLTIPMRDDEGRIGVYCLEAAEAYAFGERDLEIAGLLGAQATLALRNALLYERIPMARVFQPLAQKKERWLRQSVWGRYSRAGVLVLLAAVLIFVPVPLRVGGRLRVLPERRLPVTAEVEGRIDRVLVREGDVVNAGQVVALINDADYRAGHEEAQAELMVATREQSRLRADGLQGAAAIEAARLQGLRAELELWESRLDHARLRTPVAGLVSTPRVDELVGTKLARGEVFCEVVSPELQMIEIAVSESDAGLLDVGMPVRVKLNAYPTRSLPAMVEHIGVTASLEDAQRVFLVRARLDRMDVLLRSGMTGQAKINTGPASLGRVIFRRPARWLWSVFWGWLP